MVEVSEVGLKEEDVELDLGLSIGGSFCKSQKTIPKDLENLGAHGKHEAVEFMDLKTTREIHALRRLEARRRKEKKRLCVREDGNMKRVCKKEEKIMEGGSLNLNLNGGDGVDNGVAGYVFPCVMPWKVKEENVGSPAVAGKCFRLFSGDGVGWDPCGEDNKKVHKSDAGSMCSSSLVSDHQSSSYEGGGSSDSQSQSAQSLQKPTNLNSSKHSIRTQLPEHTTASSHPLKSDHNEQPDLKTEPNKQEEPAKKPPQPPRPLCREKPPRPQPQTLHLLTNNKMPYVSTTGGKGPNGKRVNGFLYRYNNSEVSIVCVCHGSIFSPAGFVQHAGGTDISHPERHITVINPPAFGS